MLACLPASDDTTIRFLSRTQMNTGLQKWETTQKMRSANYPTPAELDAYAKKVANNPLTIQIFPNSVKVPQRKHIRRTVNGLDTSLSCQRLTPYPSQVSGRAGLLAVLRAPAKSILKEPDDSRARLLHKAIMNRHEGPYTHQSTLNLPQPASHLCAPSQAQAQIQVASVQKQPMTHSQTVQQQQSLAHQMTHSQALQQKSMTHSQALQRHQSLSQLQTSQQILAHAQRLQRQCSLPQSHTLQPQQSQTPSVVPQQQLCHMQTMQRQRPAPHQQALPPQHEVTQELLHVSDGGQLPDVHLSQGLVGCQPLSQTTNAGPPASPNGLQQQQQPVSGAYGSRKLPDAEAPPNITVSTSTIPLSMAASLQQNRPGDLSSIVRQINQFCQARAGMGSTSVCEGQIANPSPISRNLLINASSRVSTHNSCPGSMPSCLVVGLPDKGPGPGTSASLHPQPNMNTITNMAPFHTDSVKLQQLQQHFQHQKQQQQQQQRSWAQHHLSHMQQPHEGPHPCKNPRMEPPSILEFPSRNLSYPHKLPGAMQNFSLKHPGETAKALPSVNALAASMPYTNGQYMQSPWTSIPFTASNNGSGPKELPAPFQGGKAGVSTGCMPGPKYMPGKGGHSCQPKLLQNLDFLGGDFIIPGFHEQGLDVIDKMHRPTMSQAQESSNGRGAHGHHLGY